MRPAQQAVSLCSSAPTYLVLEGLIGIGLSLFKQQGQKRDLSGKTEPNSRIKQRQAAVQVTRSSGLCGFFLLFGSGIGSRFAGQIITIFFCCLTGGQLQSMLPTSVRLSLLAMLQHALVIELTVRRYQVTRSLQASTVPSELESIPYLTDYVCDAK